MTGFIQSELGRVVESMGDVKAKVEAGLGYSSDAGDALKDIVQSVETLHVMVHEIASAAEGMTTASGEISRDIEQIAAVASQASMNCEEAMRATVKLSGLSGDLERAVGEFAV